MTRLSTNLASESVNSTSSGKKEIICSPASPVAKGECLCGAVRIEISAIHGKAAYCHCADCRKCTGSAFNISVPVHIDDLFVISGVAAQYAKQADSGNWLTRHFCRDCGSPLFTTSPVHPDIVYVKAGIFDDPSVIDPAYQSWIVSAVPWSRIPDDLPGYRRSRPKRS